MRLKALVVEDDPLTREALVAILEEEHFAVEVAIDGEIAVGLLSRETYDIVLLDVVLPKISGTDVMEQILCTRPEVLNSVIVVTGVDVAEIRKLFPEVCDTLGKPLIPNRLVRAIRQCSSGKQGKNGGRSRGCA
jgi:DNA-binding response OmpR family regulator